MKILLAIPNEDYSPHKEAIMPIGVAYINGALRAKNFDVVACNLNYVKENIQDYLKQVIVEQNVDIFLCGGTSYHFHSLKSLFKIVKQIKPEIITIGGGVGYTAQPDLLSKLTNPDYVILGEGEETTCELISALENNTDINAVKGIMYKKGEEYIATMARPLIKDINSIAFPSYEGLSVEDYFLDLNNYSELLHYDYQTAKNPRVLPILFGRSCPYDCKFCFHTIGRKYRARSFENFFLELEELIHKYSITGVTIMDEFFGINKDVIVEFCERIKKYNIEWFAELRVDAVDKELLFKMKDSGCSNVLFGLESMNKDILEEMNKRITTSQIENALRDAYSVGLTISGNFIIGTPLETIETFYQTFDWWNTHRKYEINLLYLQLYPGTQYYKMAVERGLIPSEEIFLDSKIPDINISKMDNYEWEKVHRFILLSGIDNVMNGKFQILQQGGHKEIELTCVHCNRSYTIDYTKKIWERITHSCPHCGKKNTYGHNITNNKTFENEIYKQYVMNSAYGYNLTDWFIKKEYKNVVLFGSGTNLILLIQELKKTNIFIKGIMDINKSSILKHQNSLFFENIINPDELIKFNDVDAVILATATDYNLYVNYLRDNWWTGKIDSFANAVLGHDYFIESNVREK